ncbi:hypothetical protein Scep_016224 [Stephania cephalantha]|uniref:Protein NRDE2 homolog n=1 Tax=Stephania cephalantha TaxID=152367 RepID=A0AAP0IM85_9MAGN
MDVCVKIIKNNKDFFDQSLDEIKLLKFVNKNDPADKYHILRLYDYFYYRLYYGTIPACGGRNELYVKTFQFNLLESNCLSPKFLISSYDGMTLLCILFSCDLQLLFNSRATAGLIVLQSFVPEMFFCNALFINLSYYEFSTLPLSWNLPKRIFDAFLLSSCHSERCLVFHLLAVKNNHLLGFLHLDLLTLFGERINFYFFLGFEDANNIAFSQIRRASVADNFLFVPVMENELGASLPHFSGMKNEFETSFTHFSGMKNGRRTSLRHRVSYRRKGHKHVLVIYLRCTSRYPQHFPVLKRFVLFCECRMDVANNAEVEESWEDEMLRKTRDFNRMTRECPHDEKVWIEFAEFQDKVARNQPQKSARMQTLEKKISILEKAVEVNPDNEELLLGLMKAYQRRDSGEVLIAKWEKVLVGRSGSYRLWCEFLRVVQGDFSRFKVSSLRKMYAHAVQALSAACVKLYRQVHQTGKSPSSDRAVIQQELGLVDIFVSLCRFEWQSGYQELATALFQAEIEYSLFCPSLLLSEQSKQRLFEHFWNGDGAKLGEDGALGWSTWLEKEEESKQKVVTNDSLLENDEGGWSGWSDPPSKDISVRKNLDSFVADDMDVDEDKEDPEAETIDQEEDVDSLLKKLGIDADAEADHEINDVSTWTRWSEEEISRDSDQWMPVRAKSGTAGESSDREGDEQLSRVVLFEDINEYLFSLCTEEARFSLVSQFVDFFEGKISHWICSNSQGWIEKTLGFDELPPFILDNLRKAHEFMSKLQTVSSTISLDWLLGASSDNSRRTDMMRFIRNATLLCLTVFTRNHVLVEAALVADELFLTNMKSLTSSGTPSRALAKGLLKNDRQDLLLCGVYAQREAAFGNIDLARKVFDMALSTTDGLTLDLLSKMPLLYFWYAEMELTNFLERGLESSSVRATHILSCLGSGVKYSGFVGQPSSLQLLKARQGFKEQIKTLRLTWARGDIKDESIALICSAALFESLVTGWTAGISVLEEAFSMVLPERKNQSSQLEFLFDYYIKMLRRHSDRSNIQQVWQSILHGLQVYPYSPNIFAAFVGAGSRYTVPNKLRLIFDEYCRKKPSVIALLFALSFELGKFGSHHRIHALFERALANEQLQNSVLLWRCYLAYEIIVAGNLSAAKRVFFRAIHACPWSKKLWLDGFLKLNSILTAKELADLQDVMRDKELNLRTDVYEILLQDEMKM